VRTSTAGFGAWRPQPPVSVATSSDVNAARRMAAVIGMWSLVFGLLRLVDCNPLLRVQTLETSGRRPDECADEKRSIRSNANGFFIRPAAVAGERPLVDALRVGQPSVFSAPAAAVTSCIRRPRP